MDGPSRKQERLECISVYDSRFEDELLTDAAQGSVLYCWVKASNRPNDYQAQSPARPPNAFVRESLRASEASGLPKARNADVFYAVPTFWPSAIDDDSKEPKLLIEYGPAFADFGLARQWLEETDEGKAWKKGARACTLLALAQLQEYTGPRDELDRLSTLDRWLEPVVSDYGCAPGSFPSKDWLNRYRRLADVKTSPKRLVFDEQRLLTLLDEDFCNRPNTTLECEELRKKVLDYRNPEKPADKKKKEKQIRDEASGLEAMGSEMSEVLSVTNKRAWDKLMRLLVLIHEPMLYRLKLRYNRKRPVQECGDVPEPMFQHRDDPFHPGHPSFPAGHATTAYFLAHVLGKRYKQHADALTKIASRITMNREIAGLHFGSDSAAGKKLGVEMAEMIWANAADSEQNRQMNHNRGCLRDLIGELFKRPETDVTA